jgi:hypothetical protein
MADESRGQQTADTPDDPLAQALTEVTAASLTWELSDEQRATVLDVVGRHLKLGAALRAYPLRNADEPDFVFRPYRAEG